MHILSFFFLFLLFLLVPINGKVLLSEGIVVKGKKEPISAKKLNHSEITKIPGTFGEPVRAIETMPGVGITSFLLGEFSVRGASPNANQFYVDNLPVGYIFHTLGIHSVLHRSMIENLSLETGVYSAKYQNALGGVIHIDTPDKKIRDKTGLEASLFSLSGSWIRTSEEWQDYILISGRGSTLNQTYGRVPEVVSGNTFPDYGNAQIKAKKSLDSNHALLFYTFYARDVYGINLSTERQSDEEDLNPILAGGNFDYGRSFLTSALRWEYESGRFKSQLSAVYFTNRNNTTAGLVNLDIDTREVYESVGLRQDLEYTDSFKNRWEGGLEVQNIRSFISGISSFSNQTRSLLPDPLTIFDRQFFTQEIDLIREDVYGSGYLQSRIPTNWGVWTPGGRYETLSQSKASSLTPRIRWDKTLDPSSWNVFATAGSMSRFPLTPVSSSGSPGNPDLVFEKADSTSMGFVIPWKRLWFLQVEPYYINYRDLIIRNDEYSNSFENDELGISRGVELILKKNSDHHSSFFGWISYTYSENFRRLDEADTDWMESDFDLRHNLNLVLGYKISSEWEVGLRWFARSSFPNTPIIGDDGGQSQNPFTDQRIYYPVFSSFQNTGRLPSFHRLDIRIDRNFHYEWGIMNFYLEILNIHGRNNFSDVSWNPARPASGELNPRPSLDPTTFRLQSPGATLPLINFGLEAMF